MYLVVDTTRRHILDWDTFLNLGYKTSDIVPCGGAQQYPEGMPITRLIKGATEPVYWMEKGVRRHIPDMATFATLGFQVEDISVLPDAIVALWPMGNPLVSRGDLVSVEDEVSVGRYTIQLIREGEYESYAILSAPNQPTVKIPYIYEIGKLPAADITGEGDPDVMFLRNDMVDTEWKGRAFLRDLAILASILATRPDQPQQRDLHVRQDPICVSRCSESRALA